uniref:V-type proton ATPase subunit E-like isoform X2 n=1 Tax=Rhizophora mucronata TaxID=61149 RepID=A0A2P2KXG4_RHIMU
MMSAYTQKLLCRCLIHRIHLIILGLKNFDPGCIKLHGILAAKKIQFNNSCTSIHATNLFQTLFIMKLQTKSLYKNSINFHVQLSNSIFFFFLATFIG